MENEKSPKCTLPGSGLNAAQRARMEKNRLQAVTLREAKVLPRPSAAIPEEHSAVRVGNAKYRDTGGGFLLEEEEERVPPPAPVPLPAPIVHGAQQPHCTECTQQFPASFLLDTFECSVCDNCRDRDERHALITKTEAKAEFMLRDCHLESMEPALRYLERRNPHRAGGAPMRLYLQTQVKERALQVWGGEEGLQRELQLRERRRGVIAAGRLKRDLRQLRKGIRPKALRSLDTCQHQYEETCLGDDTYEGQCTLCQHTIQYEKM